MLTKEHLKFRRRGDKVTPVLLDASDAKARRIAQELLTTARQGIGKPLGKVEEETADLTHDAPFAGGLRKLILDRLELAPEDDSAEETRWSILLTAERHRRAKLTLDDLYQRVGGEVGIASTELSTRLYADLPACRKIQGLPEMDEDWLLARYNLAQVQGLLLMARRVVITIKGASLAEKRTLFRQLKFHRLMSEVDTSPEGNELVLELSGPLAIFQNAQTYGIRLANFFPHVVGLGRWKLEALCRIGSRELTLTLTERSGLISHYKKREGYLPEELRAGIAAFEETSGGWRAEAAGDFVPLGKQSYSFADLTLVGPKGQKIYVELFHRWHAGQLKGRLAAAEGATSEIRIGVCRSLAKDPQIAALLANSAWFQRNGFLFREFPTAAALRGLLPKELA